MVSTDGKSIIINGVVKKLDLNSLRPLNIGKPIVLTAKEYYILVKLDLSFADKIYIFEKEFPIFTNITYSPIPYINFRSLTNKILNVRKRGFMNKNIISDLLYSHKKNTFKKIKKKSSLDAFFYNVIGDGYQEIFKLKEECKNRTVIALDFNSMFPSCMSGEFMNPRSLYYIDFKDQDLDLDNLSSGIYRVILNNPTNDSFNKYHPLKYRAGKQSFNFKLTSGDKVDVILPHFELEYYKNFFESCELIEGIISDSTVEHPLYKNARRVYKQRIGFKKNLDSSSELLAKFKLVSMHSVTNPVKIKTKIFNKSCLVIQFLEDNFSFSFERNTTDNEKIKIINSFQQFSIQYKNECWALNYPNNKNNESIYCFSSTVIARSRLKMLKAIMEISKFDSVDICYCNIDSIHISIEKSKLELFISRFSDSISNKMGDLKIQAIADKGYWFDVGRYWLIDNDSVIKYKNIMFNRKGGNIFTQTRVLSKIIKNDFFDYIKNYTLRLFNSFSYTKKLIINDSSYCRYTFNEIKDNQVANETVLEEMTQSKINKITLFTKIKSLYGKSSGVT